MNSSFFQIGRRAVLRLVLAGAIGIPASLYAQDDIELDEYHLWVDSPDVWEQYGVASGSGIDVSLPCKDLSNGIHTLYYRLSDTDSNWSSPHSRSFFKVTPDGELSHEITGFEWWVDSARYSRTFAPVASGEGTPTYSLPLDKLANGPHTLNLFFRSDKGYIGAPISRSFFKLPLASLIGSSVKGIKWWLDEDYKNNRFATASEGACDMTLDFGHCSKGLHLLTFQVVDNLGKLGFPVRRLFWVPGVTATSLSRLRYWWCGDESTASDIELYGKETQLDKDFYFPVSALGELVEAGEYTLLSVKASDNLGHWSREYSFEIKVNEIIGRLVVTHEEWARLLALRERLVEMGWGTPWDMSGGPGTVATLGGVRVGGDYITSLSLPNSSLAGPMPTEVFNFPKLASLDFSGNAISGNLSDIASLLREAGTDTSNIVSLRLSSNELTGNAGLFASLFPDLKELCVNSNHISEVEPAISRNVNLWIDYQTLLEPVEIYASAMEGSSEANALPSVLTYNHWTGAPAEYTGVCMANAEFTNFWPYSQHDWAAEAWFDGACYMGINAISDNKTYMGRSGDILYATNTGEGEQAAFNSRFDVRLNFDSGDANLSGGLTLADLQATVLYALDNYSKTFAFTAADMYEDGKINVQDVVMMVNGLISQPYASVPQRRKPVADTMAADIRLRLDGAEIWMETDRPVGALLFRHDGELDWNLNSIGFDMHSAGGATIAWDMSATALLPGSYKIGTLRSGSVYHAEAVSDEADELTVALPASESGIPCLYSPEIPAAVYNSQGIRVEKPTDGIFISVGPDGVRKIFNASKP